MEDLDVALGYSTMQQEAFMFWFLLHRVGCLCIQKRFSRKVEMSSSADDSETQRTWYEHWNDSSNLTANDSDVKSVVDLDRQINRPTSGKEIPH
jgi:hypothetical protein